MILKNKKKKHFVSNFFTLEVPPSNIRKAGILNQFFLFLTSTYLTLCVSMSVGIEYDTCMIILPILVPDLDDQMTKQAKQIVFDV